jgi:hypothetical protein
MGGTLRFKQSSNRTIIQLPGVDDGGSVSDVWRMRDVITLSKDAVDDRVLRVIHRRAVTTPKPLLTQRIRTLFILAR